MHVRVARAEFRGANKKGTHLAARARAGEEFGGEGGAAGGPRLPPLAFEIRVRDLRTNHTKKTNTKMSETREALYS